MQIRPKPGLAFILPLIAMLIKEQKMLQPEAFWEHTIQQNATVEGTPLGEGAYSAPQSPWAALQGRLGGPWPTQNLGWVGHNAFGLNQQLACIFVNSFRQFAKTCATRCQILRLKYTKFAFRWGFRPRWRSLQRSPNP